MLKIILLGWVGGIALMGINLPLIMQYGKVGKALLLLAFIFYLFKRSVFVSRPFLKAMYSLLCAASLFVVGYQYAENALVERLQQREMDSKNLDIIVYINQLSEEKDNKVQQNAQVLNLSKDPVNWLLYLKNDNQSVLKSNQELQLGHYYRLSGKTKPAHSYATAGAFDQEKWFIQRNIMSGFIVQHIEPLSRDEIYRLGYQQHSREQQSFFNRFQINIEKLRLNFRHLLQNSSLHQKGLILALLTGDESLLSDETQIQFKQLGIAHLLAISGPHVLIFAIMLSWFCHQVICRYYPQIYLWKPKQVLMAIPCCFGVLIYTAFVGFEIPALRTLLSVFIFISFIVLKQPLKPFALLVYSASLLLLMDPFSVLSAGFWLSYGACFILLRIYQTIVQIPDQHFLSLRSKMIFMTKVLIESQGKIFIALSPLTLLFFQQISWIAPLTNIVAVPIVGGIIVPLNILAACTWFIVKPFGNMLFYFNDILLNILLSCLGLLEKLSLPLQGISLTPLALFAVSLGILILFLPKGILPKTWGMLCCLPLIVVNKTNQPIQLHILDVGQGQAIFLQQPEQNWLIDTGGSYDEKIFSIGQNVVVPFLRQQGVKRLDRVVLSHLDQDHSGAFPVIQQEFPIKQVLSNEQSSTTLKQPFQYCHQGQQWQYPELDIQILWPKEKDLAFVHSEQNQYSCVVYLHFKGISDYQNFLIMGDAGWEAEYELLKDYPSLKVDVLVLGHHGSKHSSAYDFLATLKPKLAIASAGFDNRYGHPSQEVINRLKALHIPLKSTVEQGTLSFVLENQKMILHNRRFERLWLRRVP
ncbi:TPA: DNA internalization-related competence protein ComEC/Rec2 [Acinetobacter nosocomialis]|uniref:DNA internalization-related competence protein ComEC/Rec2 n=1 Tax=Acinetobacter nosocomialis TaxID=106654 RepID=A0AB37CXY1_ACINO|nr:MULTISPECIES: DNA internalization-related competence protein ComEC/Rec2 [Acinetobacter calcoaceticus/baumannii complex]ELW79387.1 DNA internalization competence protein ComEC/Rec2-like protein [Acinetobacter sp. OIFC021]MDE1667481.1 DNA internalization-related competence protein ComEC/Rec2 [Acinetobacter nosocomialis]MDE9417066.1 DNA internalization-related competence protein ComEC/Rec2 [Acinetobacter nosocomialis]QGA44974.1 DNA internalization-related competence protein ComEC/Rec2 [Acinetob